MDIIEQSNDVHSNNAHNQLSPLSIGQQQLVFYKQNWWRCVRSELFSEFAPHTGANDSVRSELFKHVRITLLLSGIFETKQALVSQQKCVINTLWHGVHSCAVFPLIFSLEILVHTCALSIPGDHSCYGLFSTQVPHTWVTILKQCYL